jgi:NADPH-dependent curcumin reductase CurA
MVENKALILAKYPVGYPVPGQDLTITTSQIDITTPPEGGVVLKTNYVSYDPFLRGKMRQNFKSYVVPFQLNAPLTNNAISTVVASDNARFKIGDLVIGNSDFAEYAAVPKERADKDATAGGLSILKNPLDLDPAIFLGALGMSGLTAYSSLYAIGKPERGQTIFVSASSGSVGQIVGQLAKREGMTVIGSVGRDDKLKFAKESLGFDAVFNYKTESPAEGLARTLKELGKDGLDIYYDNVGGETLDAALAVMNNFGRVGMNPSIGIEDQKLTECSCLR